MILEMIERYLHRETTVLYLQWHDNVSELFFLGITVCTIEENRRQAGFKSDTYFFLWDNLQRFNKIRRIESYLF